MLDKHNDIFSKNASDIGTTEVVTHTIEIEEGALPFKEPVRRLGPDKKLIADEQIQTLLEMGNHQTLAVTLCISDSSSQEIRRFEQVLHRLQKAQ